jgi:hypothetical protein
MKYTLTILFAIMLCDAKAQTNVQTSETNSANDKKITLIVVEGGSMRDYGKWGCVIDVIKPNICEDCISAKTLKKEPAPPVDMMVRHYFGISYWD